MNARLRRPAYTVITGHSERSGGRLFFSSRSASGAKIPGKGAFAVTRSRPPRSPGISLGLADPLRFAFLGSSRGGVGQRLGAFHRVHEIAFLLFVRFVRAGVDVLRVFLADRNFALDL